LLSKIGRDQIAVAEYNLLSNQVRYGGIGAYGQMLEACHFVDWPTLTLRPLGDALADAFPPAPPSWSPQSPDVRLAKTTLCTWGEEVSLGGLTGSEATVLREGLKGGIEAERDDDVRWECLRLLKQAGAENETSEAACLRKFRSLVAQSDTTDQRKAAALRQLNVVAMLVEPLEQLYQSLLFLFDELRVAATADIARCTLSSLDDRRTAVEALDAAQQNESDMRQRLSAAEQVDSAVAAHIYKALRDSGVWELRERMQGVGSVAEASHCLLRRHAAVQAGKYDRGQLKAPWIRLDADGRTVRVTAQRYELVRSQHAKSWHDISRHSYRTGAAGQFIQQCRIR
jgi:hypothetical protein